MKSRILKIITLLTYGILAIIFTSCDMQSNLDSSNVDSTKSPKGLKYYPKNKDELFKLARDNNINLADIDTSRIKDMSFLFANIPQDDCNDIKSGYEEDKEAYIRSRADENNISYKEALKYTEITLKACEYKERNDFSGIESWDTANATNMESMFFKAKNFNQNINSWNVGKVTNMQGMFIEATSFNQPLDKWDTSNVENMGGMFLSAESFNQNINSWNVSRVKNMQNMFWFATSFNQPLDSWNISKVENISNMFAGAKSFNQNIASWNISRVKNMERMFSYAESFNQNLESWGKKIKKDCYIDSMFDNSPLESNPPKWYEERKNED